MLNIFHDVRFAARSLFKTPGITFVVVLAASWVPAWRASRIAPTQALRYE